MVQHRFGGIRPEQHVHDRRLHLDEAENEVSASTRRQRITWLRRRGTGKGLVRSGLMKEQDMMDKVFESCLRLFKRFRLAALSIRSRDK